MINEKELVKKIKAARLIDCADPEATVLDIIKNMQRVIDCEKCVHFKRCDDLGVPSNPSYCSSYEADRSHGWIPVSERLPEVKLGEKVECIVWVHCNTWEKDKSMCMEWEHTTVRRKEVSRWLWNNSIKMDAWEVIAWMPLPKPYMKEGEAE